MTTFEIPSQVNDVERHRDAVAETGEAYTAFHGWILTCIWCDCEARGDTKRDALDRLRVHYDRFGLELH